MAKNYLRKMYLKYRKNTVYKTADVCNTTINNNALIRGYQTKCVKFESCNFVRIE